MQPMSDKVNLADKLAQVTRPWVPTVVGELNGQYVKVVKLEGEYLWHHHDHEDELFWVLKGRMRLCLRDAEVTLGPGEFFIVPRGVEHKPVADEPTEVVLFEPASTRNTGQVDHEYTIEAGDLPRL
jgi:mannose-6-phosphate isomerase-like protein (cupin superfamily)